MSKINNCPTCSKEFGFFRWRYDCSHCKQVFCDDCLNKFHKLTLCKTCTIPYEKKLAEEKAKKDKERAEQKARYDKNLKNWINGTRQEYIKGYSIIKELGTISTNQKHDSPAEVEAQLKHKSLLLDANGYIKFFWDKKIDHHDEEYLAGFGKKGNPYYKTKHYTTQYFTGHAIAVIVKDKNKKENIDEDGYKYVIECSQALEKYIEKNLQGEGKGLHEKISSIEDELSVKDIKNFRFIATARNQIIHEGKMKDNPEKFKEICKQLKLKYNLK